MTKRYFFIACFPIAQGPNYKLWLLKFHKSVHCAVLFPIYGFCTVCQLCYRHCVTCLFWFNILGEWLLAWVAEFVIYRDIVIALWKSSFEWSSSSNGFVIHQNNTVQKSTFCHCVTFWNMFRFSHLTTAVPISSAYIWIFSAAYSFTKKVQSHCWLVPS